MFRFTGRVAILFAGAALTGALAAESHKAPPRSWGAAGLRAVGDLPLHAMPPVNVPALVAEDEANRGVKDVPYRIGYAMTTDLAPSNAGLWEVLADGATLWRLKVQSRDALWVVLGFDRFSLGRGAALQVYDPSGLWSFGPATDADVRAHGELWFPPVPGDTVVLELYWPAELAGQPPDLHLGTVSHGYKRWYDDARPRPGPGDEIEPAGSGSCNIDVQCPLGVDWQDEKRAVVRLLSGGSAFCTGSLLTNTARDCKSYILTAAHCSAGASTTFQFNYERPACGSGTAPTGDQLTGAFVRANYSTSDVTLLEMDDPIPNSFNVFYGGWSRSTTPATEAWVIHHPGGDVKKISFSDDALVLDSGCGGSTHWRVDNYEQGTTEPGSSGSPLYDQNHRVVGQLHCGPASCTTISYDAYGRFDLSWPGGGTASTRLSNWLDPGGTGAVFEDGIDYTFCQVPQPRLQYTSHGLDDSLGNGDGRADPGDTVRVSVAVTNEGSLAASSVSGTLSTGTPLVGIVEGLAGWPDIPSTETATSQAPHYTLLLDPAFSCGTTISLHLDLAATEFPGAWSGDFSIPTGTANVTTGFSDSMESGANGWTVQSLSGANPWAQVTSDSTSPSHSWKVNDIATVSDSVLQGPMISNLSAGATLRFMHRVNVENDSTTYDGGVLEYSTNGSTLDRRRPADHPERIQRHAEQLLLEPARRAPGLGWQLGRLASGPGQPGQPGRAGPASTLALWDG